MSWRKRHSGWGWHRVPAAKKICPHPLNVKNKNIDDQSVGCSCNYFVGYDEELRSRYF